MLLELIIWGLCLTDARTHDILTPWAPIGSKNQNAIYLLCYKSIWDFVGYFSLALLWCLKSFQTKIYAACFCVNPWNVSKERWSINVYHIYFFLVLWSLLQTKLISGFSRLYFQFLPPTKLRVMLSTQVCGRPYLMESGGERKKECSIYNLNDK